MAKMEIVETTAFPDSDDALIRQALEGHQSAFTQLMERYREMLTIFVDSILSSNPEYLISAEDAIESKDICQVAMHKTFAHLFLKTLDVVFECTALFIDLVFNGADFAFEGDS